MKARISLVLQVADIAAERAFYRDVVGLGEPVMNSNVWVEFKLDGGTSFCLEQVEKRYRSQRNADAPEGVPCGQVGIHAVQYPDPEGNLFRVTDKQHS